MTSEATRTTGPARPAIETPDGRFEFAAHNCFGCGTLNAGGLGLVLHVEPGRAWSEIALDRRFEGWDGVIHGGILCSILDDCDRFVWSHPEVEVLAADRRWLDEEG